jgi:hypothetical protein
MTDSIKKIEGVGTVAGNGTSSANRREKKKLVRHHDEHDTVSISEEARKQSAMENYEETSGSKY